MRVVALSNAQPGDIVFCHNDSSQHAMLVVGNDGKNLYVTHHSGALQNNSTWRINQPISFQEREKRKYMGITCDALGGDIDAAKNQAIGVEMFHNFTLFLIILPALCRLRPGDLLPKALRKLVLHPQVLHSVRLRRVQNPGQNQQTAV